MSLGFFRHTVRCRAQTTLVFVHPLLVRQLSLLICSGRWTGMSRRYRDTWSRSTTSWYRNGGHHLHLEKIRRQKVTRVGVDLAPAVPAPVAKGTRTKPGEEQRNMDVRMTLVDERKGKRKRKKNTEKSLSITKQDLWAPQKVLSSKKGSRSLSLFARVHSCGSLRESRDGLKGHTSSLFSFCDQLSKETTRCRKTVLEGSLQNRGRLSLGGQTQS